MAKGSPFTTLTGKIGQTVGYILKNSNNKQTQAFRAYQPKVTNPKSLAQASQRMSMKPSTNLARALKPIIERGFEGVKYGAQSRQKFMQLALSDFNGPYLLKGDTRAVPGPFVISQGSIPEIQVNSIDSAAANGGFSIALTPLVVDQLLNSVGRCWRSICNNLGFLENGDQITLVACYRDASGNFSWRWGSALINFDDSSTVDTGLGYFETGVLRIYVRGDEGKFGVSFFDPSELTMVAAAIIASRDGDSSHLRSTSRIYTIGSVIREFTSGVALEDALNSYMQGGTAIDWPEEPTDSNAFLRNVVTSLNADDTTAERFFDNVRGYVTKGGQNGLYVYRVTVDGVPSSGLTPVNLDGTPITYRLSGTEVDRYAVLSVNAQNVKYKDLIIELGTIEQRR